MLYFLFILVFLLAPSHCLLAAVPRSESASSLANLPTDHVHAHAQQLPAVRVTDAPGVPTHQTSQSPPRHTQARLLPPHAAAKTPPAAQGTDRKGDYIHQLLVQGSGGQSSDPSTPVSVESSPEGSGTPVKQMRKNISMLRSASSPTPDRLWFNTAGELILPKAAREAAAPSAVAPPPTLPAAIQEEIVDRSLLLGDVSAPPSEASLLSPGNAFYSPFASAAAMTSPFSANSYSPFASDAFSDSPKGDSAIVAPSFGSPFSALTEGAAHLSDFENRNINAAATMAWDRGADATLGSGPCSDSSPLVSVAHDIDLGPSTVEFIPFTHVPVEEVESISEEQQLQGDHGVPPKIIKVEPDFPSMKIQGVLEGDGGRPDSAPVVKSTPALISLVVDLSEGDAGLQPAVSDGEQPSSDTSDRGLLSSPKMPQVALDLLNLSPKGSPKGPPGPAATVHSTSWVTI